MKNRGDLPVAFQDLAGVRGVLDPVVIPHIEPLMSKNDSWLLGCFKVFAEPVKLVLWQVCVSPFKVFSLVGCPITFKTGIQDHKVKIAFVERVVRFLLSDLTEKFFFGECVDAVISQDVMTLFADWFKSTVDGS